MWKTFLICDEIRDAHIVKFEIPLCYWGIPSIDVIYERLDLYEINYQQIAT